MITEVFYNPPGQDEETEFIELKNIGSQPLDLTDVRFTKGVDFDIPAGTMLAPGAFLLVVKNQAAFEATYGAGLPVIGEWELGDSLSNGGENVKLSLGAGTAIHEFEYLDEAPWPAPADGDGYSLVLRDPAAAPDHALPESWRASTNLGGSPGADDPLPPYALWKAAHFSEEELANPAISGDNADADLDGRSNFDEYAFGTDPRNPDARPAPAIAIVDGGGEEFLTVTYRRRAGATDVAFTLELSGELIGWQADEGAAEIAIADHGDGTESATVRASTPRATLGGDAGFARIRAMWR
ncbi:MAG: lamin tail domain-containing protein [Verrucomicrobiales bacterium]